MAGAAGADREGVLGEACIGAVLAALGTGAGEDVSGRPAKASGALSLDIRDSNVE